ncbi:nucleoside/nucleotide kinase family protein [Micromonospora rubida]|uniref:hypothetical protein n=1 Tax=Micromonospora rubida TaxID=2697657 RepID=UPI0013771A81|nr:hypothetical protein [Micromonospora rubida]NBE81103.1 hypothetical protein [Micromonospora rubida]
MLLPENDLPNWRLFSARRRQSLGMAADNHPVDLARRLSHVRWLAGGTGSGKSTLAQVLAERYDVLIYDGDRAERDYVSRCTAQKQPYLWALLQAPLAQTWNGRSAQEVFESMPSMRGETFGFVVDDLLAMPTEHPVLVDDFRTLPREVAPLLIWPQQAAFLLPTPQFRERALRARFADVQRARMNWGDSDHGKALARRLARDELWDAEVRREAVELHLPVVTIDGSRDASDLADDLAARFRLGHAGPRTVQSACDDLD